MVPPALCLSLFLISYSHNDRIVPPRVSAAPTRYAAVVLKSCGTQIAAGNPPNVFPLRRSAAQIVPSQQGKHTLGKPVRLFQMLVAGQDEFVEAQRVVFADRVGDFAMTADQRGPVPTPDQPDSGPQIRVDLQPVQAAARAARSFIAALRIRIWRAARSLWRSAPR